MTLKLTCPNESTAMFMSRIIQTGLTSTPKGFFDQYASIDPQEVNIEYNIEAQTIPDKITTTAPHIIKFFLIDLAFSVVNVVPTFLLISLA